MTPACFLPGIPVRPAYHSCGYLHSPNPITSLDKAPKGPFLSGACWLMSILVTGAHLTVAAIFSVIKHHRTWPILIQVMACCLPAPSPYLDQCWQIVIYWFHSLLQWNSKIAAQTVLSLQPEFDGILPKGPYPPCLRMADRALLAGYPWIEGCQFDSQLSVTMMMKHLAWRPACFSCTIIVLSISILVHIKLA